MSCGYDPGTGKRIRRSIYGKTQAEVRKKLAAATKAIDDGTYQAPSKMPLSAWLETWQSTYLTNVKHSTAVSYGQHIRNHILPALGAIRIDRLSIPQVQKFYNVLVAAGMNPKTVKNIHGILHSALEQAIDVGYLKVNPTERCKLPKITQKEIQPLDEPEIAKFLEALKGEPLEALYLVDLFTGMREGELLGLQWACVDFAHGTITVNKQLQRPRVKGEAYSFSTLKNNKTRVINPAPFVLQVLKDHKRTQNAQRLKAGELWDDHGFPDLVFTDAFGKFLSYQTVYKRYRRLLSNAGIEAHRVHDLRHTYAVSSLRAGDDVKTVQGNLGHATAAFTLDKYGHVTETMKQESAKRMQVFIEGLKSQ